jgi:hypothetical protein
MVFGNISAQEFVFDFTDETNPWGFPTEQLKETGTFTKDGKSIVVTTTNYTRWFNDTKVLLFGKKDATVTLPAFDFDVERIDVVGASGASGKVTFNIFVGDEAVSTEVTGAKETAIFNIAEGKQAAGTVYTIKNTNDNNNQIAKILIYKKGATPDVPSTPTAANIEALNALANNTAFTFTGEAQVVYLNGRYAYIKDATGSSLIYDSSTSKLANLAIGKKIAANWTGKVSIYNNLFEAVPDAVLAVTEDAPVEVTYPEVAIADVVATNMNQVVVLKGVTYTAPDGKNFTISKGGVDVKGYNQFGLEIAAPEAEKSYDITGVISVYKTDVQFQPIKIEEATQGGGSDPTPSGDFYAWEDGMEAANKLTFADGSTVQITGNESKTIGSAKKITIDGNEYTTLKISNGAENTFVLPAGKKAKSVTFYSYVNKSTADAADRDNYWADVNGTAYDAAAKGTMKDFTDSEDYLLHPDVYTFDLGSVNSFTFKNAGYQPCIVIRVALDDASNINTVKTAIIDGTRYNLAGQKVDKSYKGVVIMNGKKMIQK